MRVEDVMIEEVGQCLAGDSLRDAAFLMDREDRGALVVLAGDGSGRVEGILTDRDICLAAAGDPQGLTDLSVRSAMSAPPHVCHPRDEIRHVLEIMETTGRRRLPVVDDAGRILGAISLTDIARIATESKEPLVSTFEVCRVLVACASQRRSARHVQLGGDRA